MKTVHHFLFCILLFCMIAGAPAWGDNETPTTLRVVCYNIHHGRGMDDVFDLTRTANAIKALNPDLVALQEVDRNARRTDQADTPKILAEKLGMHQVFGKTIDLQGGDYGLLILSRFPIKKSKMTVFPDEEKFAASERRGLLEAEVELENKQIVRFATTHLCHASEERRMLQIKHINELLEPKPDDGITIVCGDFNAQPESDPIKTFRKRWTDATDGTPTFSSTNPRVKIDYIFYEPLSRFNVKETKVVQDRMTSDHLPVLVVFEMLP